MWRFLLRRTVQAMFVLLAITFLAMVGLTEMGTPFAQLGERAQSPAAQRALAETFGLDQPLPARFLTFVGNLLTGDLGIDYKQRRPVADMLAETVPNTLRLALTAFAIQVLIAVPLAIIAAKRRHSFIDVAITAASIVVTVIPMFVLAVYLRGTFSGLSLFGWQAFPLLPRSMGVEVSWLQELILPAVTLGVSGLAFLVVVARGSMIEVLEADYIRTARAKGLSERKVIYKHAARNAMIPAAELSAIDLGVLMAGSLIVETIFQYPGIGYLFVRAINTNNHPVILVVTVYSVSVFVLVLMLVDVLTAWLDPRIRTLD